MRGLWVALGFLTTFPVGSPAVEPGDLGRAAVWFPAVGLAVGALLSAANFLLDRLFPPLVAAALVIALWAVITGGLHLDGLADCCDGLLAAATPERRLEILRDPTVGAFGASGLIIFLILKIFSVAALPSSSFLLLPLATCLARWLILPVALEPAARPEGIGANFALGLRGGDSPGRAYFVAALIPLVLIAAAGWRALVAAGLAHITAWLVVRFSRARLGGITGDVFGLVVEVAELVVLLTFAAQVGIGNW